MDPETRDIVTNPPDNTQDPLLYRILVGGLLVIVLMIVSGAMILTGMRILGENVVLAVITVAAGIAGYLGGILTPKPKS